MNKRAALLDHVPGPKAAFYAVMVKGNQGINLQRLGYLGRMVRRKRKKKKRKEEANYLSIILCLTILGGDLIYKSVEEPENISDRDVTAKINKVINDIKSRKKQKLYKKT